MLLSSDHNPRHEFNGYEEHLPILGKGGSSYWKVCASIIHLKSLVPSSLLYLLDEYNDMYKLVTFKHLLQDEMLDILKRGYTLTVADIGDALYKNIRYQHIPLGWITKSLTRLVTATLVQYDTEASTYCITQRVV